MTDKWELMNLGDLFQLTSGKPKPKKTLHEYSDIYRYPAYGGNGINGYTDEFLIDKESIVIGRVGENCGAVHYINEPIWVTDNALYIKEFKLEVDVAFLSMLLDYSNLNKLSNQSGQPLISQKPIYKYEIKLPSINKQQKIAAILSSVDEAIEKTEQIIEQTETVKKGLMQQLLTRGIGHTKFKESDLGIAPTNWSIVKLEDILEVAYGKSQKKVEVETSDIPILGTGGIIGYANEALYSYPSVLIGRKGTIDRPQYMDKPFWTIDTLFYTKINEDMALPKFLFYKFKTINWKLYNEATGVPSLSAKNISRIKIQLPPIEEQNKITDILDTIVFKLDKEHDRKERLLNLKQGLMQQLLTGKVRVPIDDHEEVTT